MTPSPESWFGRNGSTESTSEQREALQTTHGKRLAMILRYIATMHHSAADNNNLGFVRECSNRQEQALWAANFFAEVDEPPDQDEDDDVLGTILFSTYDFTHLIGNGSMTTLFPSPPFSFYAAGSSGIAKGRKRTLAGAIKDSITILSSSSSPSNSTDDRACWLRLTRLVANESRPPSIPTAAVRQYLENWKTLKGARSLKNLLSPENLSQAPKVAPDSPGRHDIKSFLRRYKKYLQKEQVRLALEPMYNRLFEWLQTQQSGASHEELVWGFGNARYIRRHGANGNTIVNGPLLEVLVEVELARDGALLVRPRQHTGVSLNRQVVSAISQDGGGASDVLATLYRTVSEMETSQLSPGQPSTYTALLKRMAMQLSSNGAFQSCGEFTPSHDKEGLVVTDAWCLFCRQKPSTVWARDASDLAEQLLLNQNADALPKAAWAITHGSGALDDLERALNKPSNNKGMLDSIKSVLLGQDSATVPPLSEQPKPLFALPTSDAQDLIADLLLKRNYPAVVCEGPPGTGKTHTIANIVCAYLCQGKRVCVTSKGAPALAVLRQRLPACVQELCVDVSMSESTGMRQLQQTVERLSDRVSCVNTEVQMEKCRLLRENIDDLEKELREIDERLVSHSEGKRQLLTSPEGQELAETALALISSVPWLMQTIAPWTVAETKTFHRRVESLAMQQDKDPIHLVTGYDSPPCDGLLCNVASNAGETLSVIKNSALKTIASVPGLGTVSGINQKQAQLQEAMDALRVDGSPPQSRADWQVATRALAHDQAVHAFHRDIVGPLVTREDWRMDEIYVESNERRRIEKSFLENVTKALRLKELARKLNVEEEIKQSIQCRLLDRRRSQITARIQLLAENMVEATVVTELRRNFSVEAQSALIKFAQVAGKSKFSKSSQPSKMSQRQRRHRQDYLDAFEKCVRYTPCWVLTSSQISDYLPSEAGLFDLVIIDEASQSDITVLPGMLRGKQWLIVGDGKQVSPCESFISEAQIDSLRAALPESPLADSLLPGHSFFDLCAQAFPMGRVVLSEHFRCAPDIIDFSNSHFYDGRLIPLRLPTRTERMTPSIVDVRVDGSKVGKVNEKECDTIVSMIQELVADSGPSPRSLGIISLIGDEQSRLIRGRLLDAIGPQKYKEHNVLVGDPPTFQGAERDVIFLSLVCSVGSVPTQNQQMHAQRANVALSRARDRMVLVRSIDASHVPNREDVKGPIIEFFESAGKTDTGRQLEEHNESLQTRRAHEPATCSFRAQAESVMEKMLVDGGYSTRRMGVVWNDAICVDNEETALRAAVCIDCAGEPKEEWKHVMTQQKSIERVGWRCLRVDALTVLMDFRGAYNYVKEFLTLVGVEPPAINSDQDGMLLEEVSNDEGDVEVIEDLPVDEEDSGANPDSPSIVVISSDDEEEGRARKRGVSQSDAMETANIKVEADDSFLPEQFGDVVDLGFLRSRADPSTANSQGDDDDNAIDGRGTEEFHGGICRANGVLQVDSDEDKSQMGYSRSSSSDRDDAYLGGAESEDGVNAINHRSKRRRRRYRRLDKYSRDGRWYPGGTRADGDEPAETWYDTDSDLASEHVASNERNEMPFALAQGKTPQD